MELLCCFMNQLYTFLVLFARGKRKILRFSPKTRNGRDSQSVAAFVFRMTGMSFNP